MTSMLEHGRTRPFLATTLLLFTLALTAACDTATDDQIKAEEAWRVHVRERVADLVDPLHGLANERGAPFVNQGCGAPEREGTSTLYGCAVFFEDGTAWGGVVRVEQDGGASVVQPLRMVAE